MDKVDFFSLKGSVKTKRHASIQEEEKAAQEYVVEQYLKKEKRIRDFDKIPGTKRLEPK